MITQDNYEAWLLKYREGQLSNAEQEELEAQFKIHPEWKELAELYDPSLTIGDDLSISFPDKALLKQTATTLPLSAYPKSNRTMLFRIVASVAACIAIIFTTSLMLIKQPRMIDVAKNIYVADPTNQTTHEPTSQTTTQSTVPTLQKANATATLPVRKPQTVQDSASHQATPTHIIITMSNDLIAFYDNDYEDVDQYDDTIYLLTANGSLIDYEDDNNRATNREKENNFLATKLDELQLKWTQRQTATIEQLCKVTYSIDNFISTTNKRNQQ